MSRKSESVNNGLQSVAAKRNEERDSDDDERRECKGQPSRFCRDGSKSYYSMEVCEEEETRQANSTLTLSNMPIGHSRMSLPDRTEVVISSEVVVESYQTLDPVRVAVPDETDTGRLQSESCQPCDNLGLEVSTLGPLPEPRVPDLGHFAPTQPPSYTSVEIRRPSIPFVAPAPPPSYGEVMGIESLRSPRPPPLILNVAPSVWTHRSQPAYCRNCHAVVISKIRHIPCTFTHMAAALLFLFLCWPFCFVPYCVNHCQQARHHCPGCNQLLGTYNPTV